MDLVTLTVQMLVRDLESAVDCAARLHTQTPVNTQSAVNLQDIVPIDPVFVKSVKSFNLLTSRV